MPIECVAVWLQSHCGHVRVQFGAVFVLQNNLTLQTGVDVIAVCIFVHCLFLIGKGEGKVLPRTGHEGPEGGRGIALLFL